MSEHEPYYPWTIRALDEWLSRNTASEIHARGKWLLRQLSPGDVVIGRGFTNQPVNVVAKDDDTLYTTAGPGYGLISWSLLDIGSELAKHDPRTD